MHYVIQRSFHNKTFLHYHHIWLSLLVIILLCWQVCIGQKKKKCMHAARYFLYSACVMLPLCTPLSCGTQVWTNCAADALFSAEQATGGGKCLSCLWWQGRARSLIETRGAGRHTGTRRPLIGSWGGLSDSLKSLRLDSLIIRAGTVRSWHLVRDSPKTAPVTPRPKNTDKYSTVGGYLAIYVAWEGRQDRMCSKEFVKMLLLSLWPQWRSPGEW